eukprot:gene8220-9667_t
MELVCLGVATSSVVKVGAISVGPKEHPASRVLAVLGLLLIILGGVAISKLSNVKEVFHVTIPAGIVVIGVFFIILTIIGCVVAYKEKLVGLVFYTVFMLILLVCLIGVGGGAFTYRNDMETPLYLAWNKSSGSDKTIVEDYLKCCSWSEVDPTNAGPHCVYTEITPDNTTYLVRNSSVFGQNTPFCKQTMTDFIQKYLKIAGVAGVTIGVIEFATMLFALFLIVRICNNPRSKSYD